MNRFDCGSYCPECGKEVIGRGTCHNCGYDMPNLGEIAGKIVKVFQEENLAYDMCGDIYNPGEFRPDIHIYFCGVIMEILDKYDTTAKAVLYQLNKRCSHKWIYESGLLYLDDAMMDGKEVTTNV